MKVTVSFALLAGLALLTFLIAWQGFGEVAGTLATAGLGLLAVTAFHLIPMLVNTVAWRYLFQPESRLPIPGLMVARWVGESVNSLLPVAQVGGELAKARWIMPHGIAGHIAGASVVVDLTIAVLTQIIFTMIGLILLILHLGRDDIIIPVITGTVAISLLLAGFYIAQRKGMFEKTAYLIDRIAGGREWLSLSGGAAPLDQAIHAIYRHRALLAAASTWRLLGWMLGTGEVWLIMYFLGHPVSILEALLLESLGQAVRAAGFIIPASLGIQEGGFLLLGAALGIPAHTALALSLSKRVRELLLGLPGLAFWQFRRGRHLWKQHRQSAMQSSKRQAATNDSPQ
ncbi:MAG: lysylphosphatidylglycerol synthase domain-containing protein [Mariprofundaceae bacterium]|nr:lysylphosphatidylglycerol synthase domain-containing protein [Mariprofundaceae bacterium]